MSQHNHMDDFTFNLQTFGEEPPAAAPEQTPDTEPSAQQTSEDTASADKTLLGTESEPSGTPENYDFQKVVEESGGTFDNEAASAFAETCKAAGLSQEQADGIAKYGIGLLGNTAKLAAEQAQAEFQKEVTGWGEETKKQLGAEFDHTLGRAAQTRDYIEQKNPGFTEMLNVTGAGNHPAMIKAMAMMADLLGEDPGHNNSSAAGHKTLYDHTNFKDYE